MTAKLAVLMPFVAAAAVDELTLRLSGSSGEAFHRECLLLTNAIFAAMQAEGDVGATEAAVVLATLQAAATKAAQMNFGHA